MGSGAGEESGGGSSPRGVHAPAAATSTTPATSTGADRRVLRMATPSDDFP
ncbi:hypothetical protein ACFQXA_26820 [Nocardiopsis composta]